MVEVSSVPDGAYVRLEDTLTSSAHGGGGHINDLCTPGYVLFGVMDQSNMPLGIPLGILWVSPSCVYGV